MGVTGNEGYKSYVRTVTSDIIIVPKAMHNVMNLTGSETKAWAMAMGHFNWRTRYFKFKTTHLAKKKSIIRGLEYFFNLPSRVLNKFFKINKLNKKEIILIFMRD